MSETAYVWTIILGLGVATYLIRFSFLGLFAGRALPETVMALLRYVPTAVIPALVAPLVVFPPATGGETDSARLLAAAAALGVGALTKSLLGAIVAGMAALWGLQAMGL